MIGVPKPIHITRPRTVALKTHPKKDPVTPQLRAEVIARDLRIAGGCVAPHLDATAGECRGQFGDYVRPYAEAALTLDHVRDHAAMAMRAPSDMRHLVSLCWWHHLNSGWATSHRPLLRAYLEEHAR